MVHKHKAETVTADPPRALRLWIGILLPPLVWAAQMQTIYLTSEWACYAKDYSWNHAVSIASLVLSLVGIWVAYSEWKAVGGGTEDENSDQDTRRRFMSILGMLLGSLFTALIFAQWLPTAMGVPCSK
jgi:hypothetical protein